MAGWAAAAAAQPKLTATLDRDTVPVGESARLSLTFEGGTPDGIPSVYNAPNVRVDYVGQSSQVTIINFQATSKTVYSYNITPTAEGEHILPAVTVDVQGHRLRTGQIHLRAVKGDPGSATTPEGPKPAFARILVPREEFYVGEMFVAELQLYTQAAQDLQLPQLRSDGFVVAKSHQLPQTHVQIGGTGYALIRIQMALAAAKAGPITLGPAEWKLTLVIQSNRRRNDIFDPFGFRRPELRPITVLSEAPSLNILPLPGQGVPPGFTGAVGNFELAVSASPTEVTVGDPVTLKVRITGRGLLDAVSLPSFDHWREFKLYPPTSKLELADTLGLQGVKTFEQVIIPQNAEVKSLPPVEFSFFDPEQKHYRTLTPPPIALTVRPSLAAPQQPTILAGAPAGPQPPAQDILHIKTRAGTLATISPPLVQQPWFLTLQALPPALWLAALVWRKRKERLENNPRLLRQRRVARLVQHGLRELESFAAANRSDEFHATLFRLLQEQLGERLDLPASAITEAVIEDRVRAQNLLDDDAIKLLHVLFQACNQARYAPRSSPQELTALIPQATAALTALQRIKTRS